ncbi:MAG: alpha-glucosidase C-terminal domain-containing protein [Saprospiraceae bacterium]|nr:alpha-glucosidase C-terminal domain-containing protein [Saprospiraceae bacterium]
MITSKCHSFLLLSCFLVFLGACKQNPLTEATGIDQTISYPRVPDWAEKAVIYEVNMRQYTPEGTFRAFMHHLPRLKEMGVDILWLMPIHPISIKNRKEGLGSYYSVADYKGINPEFGEMADFDAMVAEVHRLGMHVIIDWVPNHTGWDHVWIAEHPDWYTQDSLGNIIDPINPETGESWGWTDVADLNYDNPDMRLEMISDMLFWINKHAVDGFRCDASHSVPLDFWVQCRDSIYKHQPLFMLAESARPEERNNGTFVMTYAWPFHHMMNEIAQGHRSINAIDTLLAQSREEFTQGYGMYFTSNHDENTWAGTEFERMGDAAKMMAVLSFTIDGMPLIYSGQEEPLLKRLRFFEKDTIPFGQFENEDFYQRLIAMKHQMSPLRTLVVGNSIADHINQSASVYAFERSADGEKIIVLLNGSAQAAEAVLDRSYEGVYDLFNSTDPVRLEAGKAIPLEPWGYKIFTSKPIQ